MLRLRILTAFLGLPLILSVMIFGPYQVVFIFFLLTAGYSVYEAAIMLLPRLDDIYKRIRTTDQAIVQYSRSYFRGLALFCAVLAMLIFFVSAVGEGAAGRGVLVFGLMLSILVGVFGTQGIDAEIARIFGFVLSIVYAGLPWLVIWDLYEKKLSAMLLILLLVIVWCGDTGAYFGGRFFGRHKMSPHKSPKKTWEGAFSGLVCSVIGAVVFHFMREDIVGHWLIAVSCGIFVGIAGQMGDLVESVMKRFAQVKDSGGLLPGHGGILDRVDGILTGAPTLWFVLYVAEQIKR